MLCLLENKTHVCPRLPGAFCFWGGSGVKTQLPLRVTELSNKCLDTFLNSMLACFSFVPLARQRWLKALTALRGHLRLTKFCRLQSTHTDAGQTVENNHKVLFTAAGRENRCWAHLSAEGRIQCAQMKQLNTGDKWTVWPADVIQHTTA